MLSIDELRRHLAHVSHEIAKVLVRKGLVEGVIDNETKVCDSCEWVKGP